MPPKVTNQRSPLVDVDGDGLLEIVAEYTGIDIEGASLAQDPVIIGRGASGVDGATAVGVNALVDDQNSTAVGTGAEAPGRDATALGAQAQAPANWNTTVGYDAGSPNNGENIVIVGRKAEAQGNNSVAVGEVSRANGDRATAVGRDADALGERSAAFGTGVNVTGVAATAYGEGSSATENRTTAIGQNAAATAKRAVAIGKNSVAEAQDSVALGADTVVSQPTAFGIGPRDFEIAAGRSILYPPDAGFQTLADMSVTDTPSAGDTMGFTIEVDGTTLLAVSADADGNGGVQGGLVSVPVDFAVAGGVTEVENTVTGDIRVEDGSGTEQFRFDATETPPLADFNDNELFNPSRIATADSASDTISIYDTASGVSIIDFNAGGAVDVPTTGQLRLAGEAPLQLGGSGGTREMELYYDTASAAVSIYDLTADSSIIEFNADGAVDVPAGGQLRLGEEVPLQLGGSGGTREMELYYDAGSDSVSIYDLTADSSIIEFNADGAVDVPAGGQLRLGEEVPLLLGGSGGTREMGLNYDAGSDSVSIYDVSAGDPVATFNASGEVDVPTAGQLRLAGGAPIQLGGSGGAREMELYYDSALGAASIYDIGSGSNIIDFNAGGAVDVPSTGQLRLAGEAPLQLGGSGGSREMELRYDNVGNSISIHDIGSGSNIIEFNASGAVDVPNSGPIRLREDASLQFGGTVETREMELYYEATPDALVVNDIGSGSNIIEFNAGGAVDVPSGGQLRLAGGAPIQLGGSGGAREMELYYGAGSNAFILRDLTTSNDRMSVSKDTGDLSITGELTEGAAL